MWGAKKYAALFSNLYDDLDRCVSELTLAAVAESTVNATKALEEHVERGSSMMCAQSQQLVLMKEHGLTEADALQEKLEQVLKEIQSHDNSDDVGAIFEEVRKFIDSDVKGALQELRETMPDILDTKLKGAALAFEKTLSDAGLRLEQLHDDRARLIQISCELGMFKYTHMFSSIRA